MPAAGKGEGGERKESNRIMNGGIHLYIYEKTEYLSILDVDKREINSEYISLW